MRLLPDDPELKWTPYIWLIYLGFPPMTLVMGGAPALSWIVSLVAVALFLPLYFRSFWLTGPKVIWNAAAVASLGFIGVLFNPGNNVYFIYAAASIGAVGRPALGARWLAFLVALIGLEAWILEIGPWAWGPAILFSLAVGALKIHFQERARRNAKLRMAHEEVERLAKIAERERIARDLHDLLGHTLSVVVVKSELATKVFEKDPQKACREIREVEEIARKALGEVRRAVEGYRSTEAGGLEEEIGNARSALAAVQVTLEYNGEDGRLKNRIGPKIEGVLALALREAVTNVVRHAGAATCWIRLFLKGGEAHLEVRDDGRGGSGAEGAGLAGMRERVETLGGRVVRSFEEGTSIEVILPLSREGSP